MPDVIDSYGNVKIVKTDEESLPKYVLLKPEFNDDEKLIISDPRTLVSDFKSVMKDLETIKSSTDKEKFLRDYLQKQLEGRNVSQKNIDRLVSIVMDEVFLGYGILGELMRDDALEEIMVNGIKVPIYVFHRKHGMCVTNLQCKSIEQINSIINWLSRYAGREVNDKSPLLDAHMPDGSRANVVVSPAAPYGPAITIRKFKKIPYNIVNLIELGSLSAELAAFLWVAVEGFGIEPLDILIAGGAGSGKTTLLNALAMCIPNTERIVTVEDTLELNFSFIENWVALEGSPYATSDSSRLDLHSLLKNSLRMRPDRVMVGEVRGAEAETLLVAMDIGLNGSMGTIHANNARETTIRMMEAPMDVPIRMIPLIDMIVVVNRIFDRSRGLMRRVTQVAEITGVEKDVVQMGDIYSWNMTEDKINRTEYPIMLKEKIAKTCGISKKRLNTEIYIREKVLEYMLKKGIKENKDVITYLQRYQTNPKSVIAEIKEGIKLEQNGS
ncbi:MAG: ATPase, T2SS/T4P/T4SS family [Candidatus Altiarchaeota archaeon]